MHLEQSQDQDLITVARCPICGCPDLRPLQARSDGTLVLQCTQCKMGFVEHYPADLSIYYRDEYYAVAAADDSTHGYDTYDHVAAHSLTWLIAYMRLLRQSGQVLDVGCANGYLLEGLGAGFQLYGIEANPTMAQLCRAKGIDIIGSDINDSQLLSGYANRFDIISGIAVLEHVADLRTALNQIKALLAPDGVFIFEVPLISETHDNTVWFRSSLEHIYYPTVSGLQYVFESVFGLPLIGSEVVIPQYGSVFMGTMGGSEHVHTTLTTSYRALFENPINTLEDQAAKTVRFLFDVVHTARTDSEAVALLSHIDPTILTPPLMDRLGQLWKRDSRERAAIQEALDQGLRVQTAQRDWISDLKAAGAWHVEQQHLHERELAMHAELIVQQRTHMAALQALVEQQQAWTHELEAARDYQLQQSQSWQAVAEKQQIEHQAVIKSEQDYQQTLAEERVAWIAELEAARDYHIQQSTAWEQQAHQQHTALQDEQRYWREIPWYRRLYWLLRPRHMSRARSEVSDA